MAELRKPFPERIGPNSSLVEIREYGEREGFKKLHRVFAGLEQDAVTRQNTLRSFVRNNSAPFFRKNEGRVTNTVIGFEKSFASRLDANPLGIDKERLFTDVWDHSVAVAYAAVKVAELFEKRVNEQGIKSVKIDYEAVVKATMLHDVGAGLVTLEGQEYIQHGTEGEKMLRLLGVPSDLSSIASHHTGVGLSKKVVEDKKLSVYKYNGEKKREDLMPITDLQRIITLADRLHSKMYPTTIGAGVARAVTLKAASVFAGEYGPENIARFDALLISLSIEPTDFGNEFARSLAEKLVHQFCYQAEDGNVYIDELINNKWQRKKQYNNGNYSNYTAR